jgi:hypothetical protein
MKDLPFTFVYRKGQFCFAFWGAKVYFFIWKYGGLFRRKKEKDG